MVIEKGLVEGYPITILQHRLVRHGTSPTTEVLVHWKPHPKEDATWKNYAAFKQKFPTFQP